METTPNDLDCLGIEQALMGVPGVKAIHDFHIWSLTHGKLAMTAHIERDSETVEIRSAKILRDATVVVRERGIFHSTIQVEDEKQHTADDCENFIDCSSDLHAC